MECSRWLDENVSKLKHVHFELHYAQTNFKFSLYADVVVIADVVINQAALPW